MRSADARQRGVAPPDGRSKDALARSDFDVFRPLDVTAADAASRGLLDSVPASEAPGDGWSQAAPAAPLPPRAPPGPPDYAGDEAGLPEAIRRLPAGATLLLDPGRRYLIRKTIVLDKPITLVGLNAALPAQVDDEPPVIIPILKVTSAEVTIRDCRLTGNFKSKAQMQRQPLIQLLQSKFKVERCVLSDSTKDGIEIAAGKSDGAKVIDGGEVTDIQAYRIGRDGVSITGGDRGGLVRNVLVERVRLETGYLRGAAEASDGCENVTLRDIYAKDAVYGIDVQDHGGAGGKPNVNVRIERLEVVNSTNIVRTLQSARGHRGLHLAQIKGTSCTAPLLIRHVTDLTIEDLVIEKHSGPTVPISLQDVHGARLRHYRVQSSSFPARPVESVGCSDLALEP